MKTKILKYITTYTGLTDIGLKRENNEDVWFAIPEKRVFLLADGMGGHNAGEIASQKAVETFSLLIEESLTSNKLPYDVAKELIFYLIQDINRAVYNFARKDPKLSGMGTTFACAYFHEEGLIAANVGDSRIYRLRNQELKQLTQDDSLVTKLIESGRLDPRDSGNMPCKNIITKAIGTEADINPTIQCLDVEIGDTYLMCSDGLSDCVSDKKNYQNTFGKY